MMSAGSCSMTLMLRRTASAVPLGDLAALDVWLEELHAAAVAVEVPRAPESDVVVERARVVLGQDHDIVDVGVDAVREREVDDPVLTAERNGRLRTLLGEDREAFALAAREDHRHRPFHVVDASTGSARGGSTVGFRCVNGA